MNERFWQIMCDLLPFFSLLYAANVVFLVLISASWFYGSPSRETAYVTILALVPISISLVLSTYVIRRCRS